MCRRITQIFVTSSGASPGCWQKSREQERQPLSCCWRAAQWASSSAPPVSRHKEGLLLQMAQPRQALLGAEAGPLSKAYSTLPTCSPSQISQVLVACCTSGSLKSLALKKGAATNSMKTELQHVSARDEAQSCEMLSTCNLCYSQLGSWKFSISF